MLLNGEFIIRAFTL